MRGVSPLQEAVIIINHLSTREGDQGMNEKAPAVFSLTTRRYFRVDEVARYFSVSDRTIYRLIDMGDLKAIRLRDCIRVPAEEIREFEERRKDDF